MPRRAAASWRRSNGATARFTFRPCATASVRISSAQSSPATRSIKRWRFSYQHYNTADSDGLRLTATAKQSLLIDGFSQPAVRVLDITDAGAVQELVGAVQPQKNGYGVSLLVQGVGERRLLALAGELAH